MLILYILLYFLFTIKPIYKADQSASSAGKVCSRRQEGRQSDRDVALVKAQITAKY